MAIIEQQTVRVKTRLVRRSHTGDYLPENASGSFGTDEISEISRPRGSIEIIAGPISKGSFEFSEDVMRIGRDHAQEIRLECDDAVSRECHALIGYVKERKKYAIFDGGKVNPVWVNGTRLLDCVMLKCGDIVQIGNTTLQVKL